MIFLRLLVALLLSLIALYRTDGFHLGQIEAPLLDIQDPPFGTKEPLYQTYTYLTRGKQSFIFISGDGQYILKFFDKNYIDIPFYAYFFGNDEILKRKKRQKFYRESYLLSYRHFSDRLLFIHLGKGSELPKVHIVDPIGDSHWIDLQRTPFVVQKRCQVFEEGIQELMDQGDTESIKRLIDAFINRVIRRIDLNISDGEGNVCSNWGIDQNELFQIDPGRLYLEPKMVNPERKEEELIRSTRKMERFFAKRSSLLKEYFTKQLEKKWGDPVESEE